MPYFLSSFPAKKLIIYTHAAFNQLILNKKKSSSLYKHIYLYVYLQLIILYLICQPYKSDNKLVKTKIKLQALKKLNCRIILLIIHV